MPFAVVLILLVVGSIVFHFLSPWTFTELASNWGMVDFTVDITLRRVTELSLWSSTCSWPTASSVSLQEGCASSL